MPVYPINTKSDPAYVNVDVTGGGSLTVKQVIADYTPSFGELVDGNPTAASFNVNLPAASTAQANNNIIAIANNSTSPKTVTVVPHGLDTIGSVAVSIVLSAQEFLYLVSDGISNWVITSRNAGGYVVANFFPGADIGAQINAACAALPGGGTVRVLDGDYTMTTKVIITAGVTVQLGVGTFSNSFVESATPPWLMKDNTSLIGSGWGTKIMNPVCTTITCTAVTDFVSASDNSLQGNADLVVRDIQFIRNPASTATAQGAAVQFGNITNALIDHCLFNGCEGYGTAQASSSIHGLSGNGYVVQNCTYENITTQQCVVVNCNNFRISDNLFLPTTTTNNYTIIDCEANTGTDILRNFEISRNILDFRTSAIFNPGAMIQVTGGGGVAYSGIGRGCYGIIADNVCVSGSPSATPAVYFANGININYCDFVEVVDNQIHYANVAIETGACYTCAIKDNITGTSGNNEAWHILIGNSFDCTISDNKCAENFGAGHSVPNLAETGTSDYNTFSGNRCNFYPPFAVAPGTDRYAKITILGANSRAYNNYLGDIPSPVDAPLITSIAALRALFPPGARPAGAPPVVLLGGYASQGDGGFSVWIYNSASVAVDNGITVVVPTFRTGVTGAWLRAPSQINLTTTQRNALVLTASDAGLTIWNTTTSRLDTWNGTAWTSTGPQAVTLAGTNTIDPTLGYYVKATYTSATNVTAMTISPGIDGQIMTVQLSQPAAGVAATMVTTWTNVNFAGGVGSFTATLGKHDVYQFIYDATAAKWQEVSRSLNLTN